MASTTVSVVLITRDPDVKLVGAALQGDGISTRAVSGPREVQRAISSAKGMLVAVLDGDLVADETFPLLDHLARLRDVPLLVLLPAEGDSAALHDAQRG